MTKTKNKLLFSKTDVAKLLNVSQKYLERNTPDYIKNRIDWSKGRNNFTEEKVIIILHFFRPLNPHENNLKLMHDYRGLD